jgi:RimJ/RimL family protein N-acetyltransferase
MTTERLALERLAPGHADALFHGLSDKRLYAFIDDEPPLSLEALRGRYARLATQRSPDGLEIWLNWAVRTLRAGEYIGYVQATISKDHWAMIAYVLFYNSWGYGYGREAVTAMLQELQKNHGVTKFRAFVNPQNIRSRSLLQALGFELCETNHPVPSDVRSKTRELEYVLRKSGPSPCQTAEE